MKDPENSSDAKKPDAEDMSLADLLGADVADEPSSARRVEARADEPDSGMVNLARMVAGSSVETAKTPSLAPPPPAPGIDGREATGSQAVPVHAQAPVAGPPQKSNAAIWVLVVAVIALGAAGVYFLSQSKEEVTESPGDDPTTKALLAKLEELEKDRKEAEDKRKAEEDRIAALMAKLEALGGAKAEDEGVDEAAKAALEKEIEEARLAQEDAAKKAADAAKKAADAKSTGTKPAAGTKVAATPKAETKPAATAKKPAETAKKDPAPAASGSQSELDSLLGGPKKTDDAKKPAAAPADSTPNQLSRTDIQKAMGPVAARAQSMCAKYSTGSVQVRVTVANNGRVQNTEAVGAFAGSTAGNCVAGVARTAKFPKFKDATQTFTYPIVLK